MYNSDHYSALICLDGHVADAYFDNDNDESFCQKCGQQLISKCPHCSSDIKGKGTGYASVAKYNLPNNCPKCGAPYPWASRMLDKLNAILLIDSMLDDSEKAVIRQYAPDLLIQDDNMTTSAALIKGISLKASQSTKLFLVEMAKAIGVEAIVKMFS